MERLLVLNDGHVLRMSVMAPRMKRGLYALHVDPELPADVDTSLVARALRRAIMARVQAVLGARSENALPAYFHGHARDGEALRADCSTHLAFSVDAAGSRLLIVPPHVLDRQEHPSREHASYLDTLERALEGFTALRAGRAGVLSLRWTRVVPDDSLLRSAYAFESCSDYVVCRHAKRGSVEQAVAIDVQRECERGRLPRPSAVRVSSARGVAGVGIVARVELNFSGAVRGPILLGKTRYLGGGLFRAVQAGMATNAGSRGQRPQRRGT